MTAESVQGLLSELTGVAGESSEAVYAGFAGLEAGGGLEQLVRRKVGGGRESLLGTVEAGGAVGESPEEALRRTALEGWG